MVFNDAKPETHMAGNGDISAFTGQDKHQADNGAMADGFEGGATPEGSAEPADKPQRSATPRSASRMSRIRDRFHSSRPSSYASSFEHSNYHTPVLTAPADNRGNPFDNLQSSAPGEERAPLSRPATSGQRDASGSTWRGKKGWHALRNGMRMRSKKKDAPPSPDLSLQLVGTFSAGAPAAMIFASAFLHEDRTHARIPVILDQLHVRVKEAGGDHRRFTYRIEITYGDGPNRMQWSIQREFRDIFNLHSRLRVSELGQARTLPRFPKNTIPFFRQGLNNKKNDDRIPVDANYGVAAGVGALAGAIGGATPIIKSRNNLAVNRREKLEQYLRELIRACMFRKEANAICKFLEISALGIRLSREGSYHGKEGWLVIKSAKGSTGFQITCNPYKIKNRWEAKWVLVRRSYILFTDGPESTVPQDVFLIDSEFEVTRKYFLNALYGRNMSQEQSSKTHRHPQHHTFKIKNGERMMKLLALNERNMNQFFQNIKDVKKQCGWAGEKRFDSFAPVRTNVAAQWIVDARDYFWNVSRAIYNAKDTIYIHDWWLSPELYLRRPPCIAQKWRLDRLLQKKAEEGVKIFVVIYHNVGAAIPIDSLYTKHALNRLHPNIFVLRSPSHLRQSTFFWAHHEKLCVVDHQICFVGGVDLCFGRFDTSEHVLVDDGPLGWDSGNNDSRDTAKEYERCQVWPGKDYSNARVGDFHTLDQPYQDMYDRTKIPRMGWHDIHMQLLGQPARDVSRHFVQRWNYLIRHKSPSRPTPKLLPPPDFTQKQLEDMQLLGTCEVQLLRSSGQWSLGLMNHTEHSIQNAYVESIKASMHYIYIENQFFVTSTDCEGTMIENKIGDAITERIIRAHKEGKRWQAIILIPLMPGFQNSLDSSDGTSVRIIMHAQFRSVSRGPKSIHGRLKAEGIDPDDYIHMYSLRGWGKIGKNDQIVTEMVYIHAKCMIVDDRLTIIGSANINERSLRGHRDSEVAAIVRDTRMVDSVMDGKPYKAGAFNQSLRIRLMREHLGLDTDSLEQEEMNMDGLSQIRKWMDEPTWDPKVHKGTSMEHKDEPDQSPDSVEDETPDDRSFSSGFSSRASSSNSSSSAKHSDKESSDNLTLGSHHSDEESGNEDYKQPTADAPTVDQDHKHHENGDIQAYSKEKPDRVTATTTANPIVGGIPRQMLNEKRDRAEELEHAKRDPDVVSAILDDAGGIKSFKERHKYAPGKKHKKERHLPHNGSGNVIAPEKLLYTNPITGEAIPELDPDGFKDPTSASFYRDIWRHIAQSNTAIYRALFRCMPDNEVQTWQQFKQYHAFTEELSHSQGGSRSDKIDVQHETGGVSGPPGAAQLQQAAQFGQNLTSPFQKDKDKDDGERKGNKGNEKDSQGARDSVQADLSEKQDGEKLNSQKQNPENEIPDQRDPEKQSELNPASPGTTNLESVDSPIEKINTWTSQGTANKDAAPTSRKRARTRASVKAEKFEVFDKSMMEKYLNGVRGHLVIWPTHYLLEEDERHNWLFSIDRIPPLEIYD